MNWKQTLFLIGIGYFSILIIIALLNVLGIVPEMTGQVALVPGFAIITIFGGYLFSAFLYSIYKDLGGSEI